MRGWHATMRASTAGQAAHEARAPDRRLMLVLFLTAVVLYLPGIGWGLPYATAPGRIHPWGTDELAPLGPIAELYSVFVARDLTPNPQYPLFHYLVQAIFCGPYALWLRLRGGLTTTEYPYGLEDPVSALATLTVLARLASVLMAAGVVVIAYRTALVLWDRRTGILAAAVVGLLYPMFYYARTSNVDAGALFWTAAGLLVAAHGFRDGLTGRRALALGTVAALAAATKDASAFAFMGIAAALVPWHLRQQGILTRRAWLPLLAGLISAAAVYAVASGLLFSPRRYLMHIEFIRATTAAYVYPPTAAGYLGLIRETGAQLVASLGLPAAMAAAAGLVLCARRNAHVLWPTGAALGVLIATILPVRFVMLRLVLVAAYVLALYAACALARMFTARQELVRRAAVGAALFVCGWSFVRGADLTHAMLHDSRYLVADLLRERARPGDRVAYFGSERKLPALEPGVQTVHESELCARTDWARVAPEFVLVIPQQHFDIPHEWSMRNEVYRGLVSGSLGYERIAHVQARSLTERRPVSFVNPPVDLYARRDRGVAPWDGRERRALLAGLEASLGLEPRIPPGLVRNPVSRGRSPCADTPW